MVVKDGVFGAMSALITPFKDDLSLDLATFERLIWRQIEQKMDALLPVGTTGESATLTHKEHMECIEIATAVAKKHNAQSSLRATSEASGVAIHLSNPSESVIASGANAVGEARQSHHLESQTDSTSGLPRSASCGRSARNDDCRPIKVLAGAGSNSTAEAIELAKFAQKCGADAILCVTPYYNKPTQQGLIEHYTAIAKSVDIPLVLYNVPGRTGVNIENATAIELFKSVPNIYAIKEAAGSMEKVVELNAACAELAIFSGDDAINYPILAHGGVGVISVTGNIAPNLIAELTHAALNGDHATALKISQKLYPLNKILFCESNPIPIKAAMHAVGLLPSLTYRLPLVPPSKENLAKIAGVIEKYDIIK